MITHAKVLLIVATVRTGRERWEGEATYLLPTWEVSWQEMQGTIWSELVATLPVVIDLNLEWKLSLDGQVNEFRGPAANSAVLRECNINSKAIERWQWTPIVESRYTLMGGN